MYPPGAEFIRAMEGKKERKGRREGRRKEERKGRRRERKKKGLVSVTGMLNCQAICVLSLGEIDRLVLIFLEVVPCTQLNSSRKSIPCTSRFHAPCYDFTLRQSE